MTTFNPHANRTSDGTVITEGLRVIDYNRRPGTVVKDRDAREYTCPLVNPDLTYDGCHNDHWFDVQPDDANFGSGMFNGERLQAIR